MVLIPEDLLKVVIAVAVGGLIGLEREFRDKAAGLRTMIFICLGATLFTIFSVRLALDKEPTRIAANIVVGVGFLGAGVILREAGGRVTGLTTAATIWLVAALGTGIGGGDYLLSAAVGVIAFVVLWLFPRLERVIDLTRSERTYRIVTPIETRKLEDIQEIFKVSQLRVRLFQQEKKGGKLISYWYAAGKQKAHERLMESLIADPEIEEFHI